MLDRPEPWWDFPRDTIAVRMFVETGADHGVDVDRCLAGTGLTEELLAGTATTVRADQELAVGRNLLAAVGDRPGLGLQVGLRYSLGRAGVLGFAIISSSTVREAVEVCLRYVGLSSAFTRPRFEEDHESCWFVLDDADLPQDVRPMMVERDLVSIAQLIPFIAGDLDLSGVSLDVGLDADRVALLAEVLPADVPVRAAERTAVVMPRALLDLPLPAANADTADLCVRQCAELLDQRQARLGVSAQVRAALLRNPTAMPSMDAVAAELHLDARTLHRRLSAQDVSFRVLVGEVRRGLAVELLAGLTVGEVARRLGYSEVSAFSRAFKRWTGQPPQDYRRS